MGNMSYCRMENTSRDLNDVVEHIKDKGLSKTEHRSRLEIVRTCYSILEELGVDIDTDVEEVISGLNERNEEEPEDENDLDPAGGYGLHSHK